MSKSPIHQQIQSMIDENPVILFMKGTRKKPQCGFSSTVVQILDHCLAYYQTVDVLADEEIRQGIKDFSNWPTIPQLYVNGEFIGGCDIVRELNNNGELFSILSIELHAKEPALTITQTAAEALKKAIANAPENQYIRLSVNACFANQLSFDDKSENDRCISINGLHLLLDPISATRAHGICIDFVQQSPKQGGFEITNPNLPPAVKVLTPIELKDKWDDLEPLLIDVRNDEEWKTVHIVNSKRLVDLGVRTIQAMDKKKPLVFVCHHGGRSQKMAEQFRFMGFENIYNLQGGIDAWAESVDPTLARY